MPLNDLTCAEFMELRHTMDCLQNAVHALTHLGDVRIDMTPGARMCIMLPTTMPAMARPELDLRIEHPIDYAEMMRRLGRASGDDGTLPTGMGLMMRHEEGAPLSGLRADAADVPDTSRAAEPPPLVVPAASEAAKPEDDGGADTDGGAVAAAAPEPSASPAVTQSAPDKPASWTVEEDARLVDLVTRCMLQGLSKSAAVRVAAQEMGRPVEGTRFRCYTKLAAVIADAIAVATAPTPSPAVDDRDQAVGDQPQAVTPAEDAAAAAPTPAAAAHPPGIDPELARHIAELPRKYGWTLQRDIDLLTLMTEGWGIPEIAQDLNLDGAGVKSRWDVLSDLHEADEGRNTRSWTKEQLLPALQAMLPPVQNHPF